MNFTRIILLVAFLVSFTDGVNPNFPPIADAPSRYVSSVWKYNGRLYGFLNNHYNANFQTYNHANQLAHWIYGNNDADGVRQYDKADLPVDIPLNGSVFRLSYYAKEIHVRLLPIGWENTEFSHSADRNTRCTRSGQVSIDNYIERDLPEGSLMWYFDKLVDLSRSWQTYSNGPFVHPVTKSRDDFMELTLTDSELVELFGTHDANGNAMYLQFPDNRWAGVNNDFQFQNDVNYPSGSKIDRDVFIASDPVYAGADYDEKFNFDFKNNNAQNTPWLYEVSSDQYYFSCKRLDTKDRNVLRQMPVEIITEYTTDFHTFQLASGTQVEVTSSLSSPTPLTTSQQNNIKTAYSNTLAHQYPSITSWSVSIEEQQTGRRSIDTEQVEMTFKKHLGKWS